jgi:hypothetical protein
MAEAVSSWQPWNEKSYVGREHLRGDVPPAVRGSSEIFIRRLIYYVGRKWS